jgi:hypothetical protein
VDDGQGFLVKRVGVFKLLALTKYLALLPKLFEAR